MKILFVAAEVTPLVKVGGLADVVGSLPQALTELGHDVRVMIPQYGSIDLNQYPFAGWKDDIGISIMGKTEPVRLGITSIGDKLSVYLVKNDNYFGGEETYGQNDLERFSFFSRAAFELLPRLGWQPEIVHCHDWHTALLVMWLKKAGYPYTTILTIHNLAYQGLFDEAFLAKSGLEQYWTASGAPKPPLNYLSQGILWADLVTTVSETYAREIVTPGCGCGLDSLLRLRQKDLVGIVNGIDYEEYNPRTDPYIVSNYDATAIEGRAINKLALQKRASLPEDAAIPLIGMVQRLDEQKGFGILEQAIDRLLQESKPQLVILGKGREHYENMLRQKVACYPEQMALFAAFDNPLAHLIYAGCDMFLMPSCFEPCGLGQLIAMRYGALPIVRHTGGLIDTVPELTPDMQEGSGFVFRDYTPEALKIAVNAAAETFRNKKAAWYQAKRRVMNLDFSWKASALKYEAAYQELLKSKRSLSSV